MRHVLICDAEPMFRYGLAHQLACRGWTASIAEAGTVAEALGRVRDVPPAVIVADAVLPDGSVGDLLTDPAVRSVRPRVVVVRSDMRADGRSDLRRASVRGEPVHAVLPRRTSVERLIGVMGPDQEDGPCLPQRQRQVLALVCRGWSNRAIADELGIHEKTVRNCLTRAFRRLSVQNRTQAAMLVMKRGLRPAATSVGDDHHAGDARPAH